MSSKSVVVDERISFWRCRSNEDAARFHARWPLRLLLQRNPGLAAKINRQNNKFVYACIAKPITDIERHGAALRRVYTIATIEMEICYGS